MKTSPKNQTGFTLVELLIVVIILGILAAVVIPQFNSAASETRESAIASNLATLRQAVEMYKVQHNDLFPGATIVTQLTTQTDMTGAAGTDYGPYVRQGLPNNPLSGDKGVNAVASMPAAPTGTDGWIYDTTTGEIRCNSTGTGPSGTDYFDL